MQSPQPSDSLSIEEMEAVMKSIENGAPQESAVPTLPQVTTVVDAVGPAANSDMGKVTVGVLNPTPEQAKVLEEAILNARPMPIVPVEQPKPKSPIEAFVTADELADDVAIDPDDLDAACVSHAARFVHYANLRAKARGQFEKMKAAFEILESKLYAEYREKLAGQTETVTDSKGKELTRSVKPTEAMIDAAVKADKRWWAGKNRLIDAQMVYDLASNAASAFEQRRDMIVQMGSDRRQQRQGEVRIRESANVRENAMAIIRENNARILGA